MAAFSLYSPKIKTEVQDEEGHNILHQLKRFYGTGFYTMSIFLALISGFMLGSSPFRVPYATSLGLPIIFAGTIMAISRMVWFIIGNNLEKLKKLKIENILLFELFFFPFTFILLSQASNIYFVAGAIAISSGYYFARNPLIEEYYLNNFLINKKYKATMISIKAQFGKFMEATLTFAIGILMGISFKFGYLISGITLFVLLIIVYPKLRKILKN